MNMKIKYLITGPDSFMVADNDKSHGIPDNRHYVYDTCECLPGKDYMQKRIGKGYPLDSIMLNTGWVAKDKLQKEFSSIKIRKDDNGDVRMLVCSILESITVFHSDNIIRISFVTRTVNFVEGFKYKREIRTSYCYVFNTKSGFTYCLPARSIENHIITNVERGIGRLTRFSPYKYFVDFNPWYWNQVPSGIKKILFDEIGADKQKIYGFTPTSYGDSLRDLSAYNRYAENSRIMETSGWFNADLRTFNKYVLNADDPFCVLCEAFELPANRMVRKFFLQNERNLNLLSILYKNGFDSPDDIRLLMSNESNVFWSGVPDRHKEFNITARKGKLEKNIIHNDNKYLLQMDADFASLMDKITEYYKGNTHLIAKWLSRSGYWDGDILRMLRRIEDAGKSKRHFSKKLPFHNKTELKKWLKKEYLSDWDKKDHDDIATVENLMFTKNHRFEIVAGEKKLEEQIEGYDFHIARDSNTLRAIGRDMTICVGSYSNLALNKYCTIAYVTGKNNDYECCIELHCGYDRKNKFTTEAHQVKLRYNDLLKDHPEKKDLSDAIRKWMNSHEISCFTSDFDAPKTKEIYESLSYRKQQKSIVEPIEIPAVNM